MKSRVYIETSVVSYLTARPSANVRLLARQQATLDFWDAVIDQQIEAYVSDLVVSEISRGDPQAAARRLATVDNLPQYRSGQNALALAERLIACGAVPSSEPEDALHIALATLARVDYLASWNFAHFVGPHAKRQLAQQIVNLGWPAPLLATPDEILEEIKLNRMADNDERS